MYFYDKIGWQIDKEKRGKINKNLNTTDAKENNCTFTMCMSMIIL